MEKQDKASFRHGDKIRCPTCGTLGRYDEMNGGVAEFDDAIWFNWHPYYDGKGPIGWECHECYLK
jgi:hypothetical protein